MPSRKTQSLELLLVAACGWFFFMFGLGNFGLVGADEPRYAQVAREMFERHDFVTPTLFGQAWLEKPALYYWRTMFAYETFGVHDWAARIPSATFALGMVVIIFFHMRRFRPGAQLDAALITASCAAVIGFSRGASTDMQLAAPFTVGMLGWYAWYETGKKFWLFDLYFFIAVGTLAKGPVAPFLAGLIILLFCAVRRDWRALLRTLWLPGIALYILIALPWYVAVQLKNPQFLRVFIFEHNLARYGTDTFHHVQPVWYYLPVLMLALIPWTFFAIPAVIEALHTCVLDWRTPNPEEKRHIDSFPEFLIFWAFIPILFFSFSKSKLPGYILPAIAPFTILTADWLQRRRSEPVSRLIAAAHAALAAALLALFLYFPYLLPRAAKMPPSLRISVAVLAVAIFAFVLVTLLRTGTRYLRFVTLVPVVLALAYVLRIAAPAIDDFYSARPVARALEDAGLRNAAAAVFNPRRELLYGLEFYRDQRIADYNEHEVPHFEHLVIAPLGSGPALHHLLPGRKLTYIGGFTPQRLEFFWVSAEVGPPAPRTSYNTPLPPAHPSGRRAR